MNAADQGRGGSASLPQSTALVLQCVVSVAGTMVGEALGETLVEKLVAGLLLCVIGAFLTAPGRHHRRRVVAVAMLLALLEFLRRAAGALASPGRDRTREVHAGALLPVNWATVGLATTVGFGVGSLGTTAIGGWPSDSTPTTVSVPVVAGKSEAAARSLLEQSGLTAVRTSARSASVQRGFAIRTAPAAGTDVRAGSSVAMYVSSGPPGSRVTVPAVRGLPEREARFLLADLGLQVTRHEAPSEQIASGKATGTSPSADSRVRMGSRVTLFVSSGPPDDERVVVPSVDGRPERVALRRLRDAGLDPIARPTPSEDVRAGLAIGTVPAAGARVDRGARVRLLVSSGSGIERVQVPPLVGNAIEIARARLDELGLRAESKTEDSSEPAGTVVHSDPAAGTVVAVNTVVQLVVSSGALVRVPDVVGTAIGDAKDALTRSDLGLIEHFVRSTEPSGTVTKTDPAAGSEVARHTDVNVYISCGSSACVD